MMEIINLTNDVDFYRDQILNATQQINDDTDDRDANHLVELTRIFAQQGDVQARQIIYDTFLKNLTDEETLGTSAIIEIDKVEGFIFVAEKLAEIKQQKGDHYGDDYLLFLLEEEIGEKEAQKALAKVRSIYPKVDFYLQIAEESRAKRTSNLSQREDTSKLSYTEVKEHISYKKHLYFRGWGQQADEQSLLQAAKDLFLQDDPHKLWQYLRIFAERAFPLDPKLLFPLMDVVHPYYPDVISVATLKALSNINHTAVREFAFKLIKQERFVGRAVELFVHNFEQDDWGIIEELSTRTLDDEDYHSLQGSVQDVFKQHSSKSAATTLQNLFEYGPCSHCRERIIMMLRSIDALPMYIQEECLYDSNEDIRKLAKNGFEIGAANRT